MYYNDQGEEVGYTTITRDNLGFEVNESTFYEIKRVNDSLYLATAGYFYGEEDNAASGEIVFDTTGKVYHYSVCEDLFGAQSIAKTFDNKYTIATAYWYPDLSYDVYGKQVHSERVYQYQGESEIGIHNWQKGIYFVIVYSKNKIPGNAKFTIN